MSNLFVINYTFIIPHKDSPILLKRCLDSIPRRSDVQIIVVDDNSNSQIVDFSHFPGESEDCVEVYFSKENKGAGYARNLGIKHAKGKWLLFADADDFYVDNLLTILDEYLYASSDIIFFRTLTKYYKELINEEYVDVIDDIRAVSFNNLYNTEILNVLCRHIVPWSKMIRHSIVRANNIMFDEIICSNDVMFSIKLVPVVTGITISEKYIYCVTKATDRNLTSRKDYNSGLIRLNTLLNRNRFLIKHGYKEYLIPPLSIVWDYRKLGFIAIMKYCFKILFYRHSGGIFFGLSKILKRPMFFIKRF